MVGIKAMRRRDILKLGALTATVLPGSLRAEIPTTNIDTLNALFARGEFMSVDLDLEPPFQYAKNLRFYCDGIEYQSVSEIYAPKDGVGWIVYYVPWDESNLDNRLRYVRGKVEIIHVESA